MHVTRAPDTVVQSGALAPAAAPTIGSNFDGMGVGFGSYTDCCAPPDTNGDVGPNHYVQIVNSTIAIFSKGGALLLGPVQNNTLWSSFGGGCETNNDGDPTVLYDPMADRWVISQFSVSTQPYLECVAVSTAPDPTGSYYRYAFSYGNTAEIDYPKMGVWPDAYYETYNVFNGGTTFAGARVCAFDRNRMLSGSLAAQQCFNTSVQFGSLLPSDLDGSTPPPAGTPNYLIALDAPTTSSVLQSWKFHVDWTTPSNSTFTGPSPISVATYTNSCAALARGDCIPQGGTTQTLESLADRAMYRLAYRNFGDHEALVFDHTVEVGSGSALHSGIRWYELRPSGGNLTLYQQGTYAPDANWRWLGSAAMDRAGNLALGYSVSSSSLHPQIHFTGRLAGDAAGVMTQGENVVIDGGGSQIGGLARWGDYSMLAVDPADDCTFWYTNEYLKANGSFNWSTRIASFTLPGCASPDFSLVVSPTSQNATPGASTSYTVTITQLSGFSGAVTLSASGLPSGASGSFSPNPATSGSTLTVTTTASTPTGSYPFTVTGTSGSLTHTASATLVVLPPPPTVTAISPTSGPATGGTAVTITGTGFSTTAGATTVAFGPNAATGVSCATTTSCSATSPAGTGTVDVRVTVGGQTSATSAADQFTYTTAGDITITFDDLANPNRPLSGSYGGINWG
ncbi:MAG TPA: IPT/TIG domain-containing protein, partial [Candidatus Acidoferrales bacterium]|nr:IPT/TIG domain-containing protein [Candidatus Acidoferrales bacterium]